MAAPLANMNSLKQQVLRYMAAMNATALQSAVHALRTYCGMAGVHQVTAAVPAINVQQAACVFLFAFGAAVLNYLDTHPIGQVLTVYGAKA